MPNIADSIEFTLKYQYLTVKVELISANQNKFGVCYLKCSHSLI